MQERFILWLASAGYSGYFPYAPGTVGTLVGILVYMLFSLFPPPDLFIEYRRSFLLGLMGFRAGRNHLEGKGQSQNCDR